MSVEWVEIGPCRIACGDCLEILPTLEPGSVDAVLTDPPYGIDYQSAWRTDKAQWKPKILNDEQPFIWFLPGAFNAGASAACLICFCRWDAQEAFSKSIGWAGWKLKSQVIWDRESHGMGDLHGSTAPQHDVVWFATKGDWKFSGNRPKSVVRSMRLSGEELIHPNEKPVGLMESPVRDYSSGGDCVLDCFMGSGTTGVACIKTGRRFIGIEKEPKYFETARKRLERAWQEKCSELPFEPEPQLVQPPLFEDQP